MKKLSETQVKANEGVFDSFVEMFYSKLAVLIIVLVFLSAGISASTVEENRFFTSDTVDDGVFEFGIEQTDTLTTEQYLGEGNNVQGEIYLDILDDQGNIIEENFAEIILDSGSNSETISEIFLEGEGEIDFNPEDELEIQVILVLDGTEDPDGPVEFRTDNLEASALLESQWDVTYFYEFDEGQGGQADPEIIFEFGEPGSDSRVEGFQYEESSSAEFNLLNPENQSRTDEEEIQFEYEVDADNDGEVDLVVNDSVEATDTVSEGLNQITNNVTLDFGQNYEWYVNYSSGDETLDESETKEFAIGTVVENTGVEPDPAKWDELVNITVEITEQDLESNELELINPEGQTVFQDSLESTEEENLFFQEYTIEPEDENIGEWVAEVTASSTQGTQDSDNTTFEVEQNSEPNVDLESPEDSSTNETPVTFEFTPECFSEDGCGSATLLIDDSEGFVSRESIQDVENNTINDITYDFEEDYELPDEFNWDIEIEQSDGLTSTSGQPRTINVEESSIPEPEVDLNSPENNDEKESPVDFEFTPTCYTDGGCGFAYLYYTPIDTELLQLSETTETGADWNSFSSFQNLTTEDDTVLLDSELVDIENTDVTYPFSSDNPGGQDRGGFYHVTAEMIQDFEGDIELRSLPEAGFDDNGEVQIRDLDDNIIAADDKIEGETTALLEDVQLEEGITYVLGHTNGDQEFDEGNNDRLSGDFIDIQTSANTEGQIGGDTEDYWGFSEYTFIEEEEQFEETGERVSESTELEGDYDSSSITWQDNTPEGTSVSILTAVTDSESEPESSEFEEVGSKDSSIPQFEEGDELEGLYLWTKQILETSDNSITPELDFQDWNLTYESEVTEWEIREELENPENDTINILESDFSRFDLPKNFTWNVQIEDEDGKTSFADQNRTIEINGTGDPVLDFEEVRIFNVTNEQDQRNEGNLLDSDTEVLKVTQKEREVEYRYEIELSNTGEGPWELIEEDSITNDGINEDWNLTDIYLQNDTDTFSGGSKQNQEVEWVTDHNLTLYPDETLELKFIYETNTTESDTFNQNLEVLTENEPIDLQKTHDLNLTKLGFIETSTPSLAEEFTVNEGSSFIMESNTTCSEGDCGEITKTSRYNESGTEPNTPISETESEPLFTEDANPEDCQNELVGGEHCIIEWNISVTGETGTEVNIDALAESSLDGVELDQSKTSTFTIQDSLIVDVEFDKLDFGTVNPGDSNVSATNNSEGYNVSIPSNSIDAERIELKASRQNNSINDGYFIEPDTIGFSKQNDSETQESLSNESQILEENVESGTTISTYYWQDVPTGIKADTYRGVIEFEAFS